MPSPCSYTSTTSTLPPPTHPARAHPELRHRSRPRSSCTVYLSPPAMNTVQLAYDRPPPLLPHLPPDYWLNYMLRPSPLLFSSFLMLSHSHTAAYEQYMILLPWRTSHIHKHSARILGLQPRQRLRAVGVSCHRALHPPPRVHPALYPRKRRAVLPGRAGHLRDITSLKILRNPTKCPVSAHYHSFLVHV